MLESGHWQNGAEYWRPSVAVKLLFFAPSADIRRVYTILAEWPTEVSPHVSRPSEWPWQAQQDCSPVVPLANSAWRPARTHSMYVTPSKLTGIHWCIWPPHTASISISNVVTITVKWKVHWLLASVVDQTSRPYCPAANLIKHGPCQCWSQQYNVQGKGQRHDPKARDLSLKSKGLNLNAKAKARDLIFKAKTKAKAKNLSLKAKATNRPICPWGMLRPKTRPQQLQHWSLLNYFLTCKPLYRPIR